MYHFFYYSSKKLVSFLHVAFVMHLLRFKKTCGSLNLSRKVIILIFSTWRHFLQAKGPQKLPPLHPNRSITTAIIAHRVSLTLHNLRKYSLEHILICAIKGSAKFKYKETFVTPLFLWSGLQRQLLMCIWICTHCPRKEYFGSQKIPFKARSALWLPTISTIKIFHLQSLL